MGKKFRVLFIDFGTSLESLADYTTKAQGGRVGSLLEVPNALSQLGHEVAVLSDIKKPGTTPEGVYWYSHRMIPIAFLEKEWDFLVANRGIADGYPYCLAKRRILWTHDLPHPGFIKDPRLMQHFHTVFMSRYAERVWRIHYPLIGKSSIISNGVDRGIFYSLGNTERKLKRIVYISSPNRGLHRLPAIAEVVNEKLGKPLEWIAYSNQKILHPMEGDCNNEGANDNWGSLDVEGAPITLKDPVTRQEIADVLRSSGMMVVPTGYPEICSNATLQALACGVPVVTAGIGSAGEWIKSGWNGYLTKTVLSDYMVYLVEMARAVYKIVSNPFLQTKMCNNAAATKIYSWQEIGAQWEKMLKKIL